MYLRRATSFLYRNKVICAAAVLLVIQLYFIWSTILVNIPYPSNFDEPVIMDRAATILRTGDYNPHYFNYPSLPTYIAAIAMAVGYLQEARHLNLIDLHLLPAFTFPYYPYERMSSAPKLLFASLGVLAGFIAGFAMARTFGNKHFLWMVPLGLSFSSLYTEQLLYLNPNIAGVFFMTACLGYFSIATPDDRYMAASVVPGFLVGLTTACKYNFCLLLLAPVISLWLYPHTERARKVVLLLLSAFITFLMAVPFSILDLPDFLYGVAAELYHYAIGHSGSEEEPGLPQLCFFMGKMISELGPVVMVLSLLGLIMAWKANWRGALVLSVFPISLLITMSLQRTNFIRNLLPFYVWVMMFASLGLAYTVHYWLTIDNKKKAIPGVTLLIICLFATLPWNSVWLRYSSTVDSRTLTVAWVQDNIPAGSTILMPAELGIDYRAIETSYKIITYKVLKEEGGLLHQIKPLHAGYLLLPLLDNEKGDIPGEIEELAAKQYQVMPALAQFGTVRIWTDCPLPMPFNNPKIMIYQFTSAN